MGGEWQLSAAAGVIGEEALPVPHSGVRTRKASVTSCGTVNASKTTDNDQLFIVGEPRNANSNIFAEVGRYYVAQQKNIELNPIGRHHGDRDMEFDSSRSFCFYIFYSV